MGIGGPASSVLGNGQIASFCEHGNEISHSIYVGKFMNTLKSFNWMRESLYFQYVSLMREDLEYLRHVSVMWDVLKYLGHRSLIRGIS
jgi:hypothetical protein